MACDLQIAEFAQNGPYLTVRFTSSAGGIRARLNNGLGDAYNPYFDYVAADGNGRVTWPHIPEGEFQLNAYDANNCTVLRNVQVVVPKVRGCTNPFASNWNPDATDDDGSCQLPGSQWFAVGGLYPPVAALATPVSSLFKADQTPRQGLYVEVELYRITETVPFARLRQAVRSQYTTTNAEPYLRGLLDTEAVPVRVDAYVDDTATVVFNYRYREVDSEGVGQWRQHPASHYAVLSAPESSLRPYIAGSDALPLTAFAEPTQFVGYPLEVSAVLPADRLGTWYAQWRYLDSAGRQVEVKAVPLPADLPAGVVRLRVPPLPPVCAASVELTLMDIDRTSAANCAPVVVTPPTTTPVKPAPRDFNSSDFNTSDYR
ncbi:hypothetical protein MUN82_03930 [Hymenobacter aerilatus]|uniref:Uncharacterized protein n=1 Tax=Hymenobacter aerilatus TaxID=2932251 RepID=A0A8T9SW04_9BACT|nr:hypothetical protein [Hymenobacter aerilatus]UOR06248.1 hypothetical protein MUN82_03930 [Hymenobacter aerilatus]